MTQADILERRSLVVARVAAPHYVRALEAIARGDDPGPEWNQVWTIIARAMVLSGLLGRHAGAMTLRSIGIEVILPRPVRFGIELQAPIHAPFDEAVRAFEGRVPELARAMEDLSRRYSSAASIIANADRQNAIKRFIDFLRKRTTATEAAEEELREDFAVTTNIAEARLETIARTTTLGAYNAGYRDQLRDAPGVIPVYRLSEIKDSRTRGNPRGLYPDKGKHWQMDGFCAAADDPIWTRIWPPNGYQCRATIDALTWDDVREKGWLDEKGRLNRDKLRSRFSAQRAIIDRGEYPDEGFAAYKAAVGL